MDETDRLFLDFSANKLRELASRIEECLGQLSEEQVWARGQENENAAGKLVLHLCGNVRQWVTANISGLPNTRERDGEFSARGGRTRSDLLALLRNTVSEAAAAIETIPAPQLPLRRVIQGYDTSFLEAIFHAVEHFSMHTGQIVFITKMLTGADLGFYRHLDSGKAAHH